MKSVEESTVAMDVAVSNPPLGKLKTRKRKMKWSDIVKEESEPKQPTGKFHGSRRMDTWTYYGDGGQQVVITQSVANDLPEIMSAEDLLKIKTQGRVKWNYYPKGKLF